MKRLFLIVLCIGLVVFVSANANAQVPKVTAKTLLRTTVSGDDAKQAFILSVEFPQGSKLPLHTHPGDEYTTILQGTLELVAEGRETRRVSAGEAYHCPAGLVHQTRNVGDTPVRAVTVFVVDKGEKVVQPVTK